MKLYFASFASDLFYGSLTKLEESIRSSSLFDVCKCFRDTDLKKDDEFWPIHGEFVTSNPRGYGYWLWKPYVVLKTLREMSEGDVLMYCDSGCTFNNAALAKLRFYVGAVQHSESGLLGFGMSYNVEKKWTKKDLFLHLECERLQDTSQVMATAFFVRKTAANYNTIQLWFDTATLQNYHFLDDSQSIAANDIIFKEHRHDQSIFSLLFKLRSGETLGDDPERHHNDNPIWATRNKIQNVQTSNVQNVQTSNTLPIQFFYGNEAKKVDVTAIAMAEFFSANMISIGAAVSFNALFSDVLPGKLKTLQIYFNDDNTSIKLTEERSKDFIIQCGETTLTIPKRIIQYWDRKDISPPQWAVERTRVLRKFHGSYDYHLFHYDDALKIIDENFDKTVLLAFKKCNIAAMRSDLFRYCYLFAKGGIYFDLKTVCHRNFLDELTSIENIELVVLKRNHTLLFNGFIASRAGSLALKKTIDECVSNILEEKTREVYITTGTPIYTKHCKDCYGSNFESSIVHALNYDAPNCTISFAAAEYVEGHWSVIEKSRPIYRSLNLCQLLQVDKIFVLNLAKRVDRLDQCRAIFKNLYVADEQWERFDAFLGADKLLQEKFASTFAALCEKHQHADRNTPYLQGGFGCLLTHYHAIKTAKERGYKRVLILEDDFEPTTSFENETLLQKIGNLSFDMFYLSMSVVEPPVPTNDSDIVQVKRNMCGAAYIVNHTIFDRIIDECLNYAMQIDVFYADIIQKNCHVLSTVKSVIVQREGYSDIVQRNIKYKFET